MYIYICTHAHTHTHTRGTYSRHIYMPWLPVCAARHCDGVYLLSTVRQACYFSSWPHIPPWARHQRRPCHLQPGSDSAPASRKAAAVRSSRRGPVAPTSSPRRKLAKCCRGGQPHEDINSRSETESPAVGNSTVGHVLPLQTCPAHGLNGPFAHVTLQM